MAVWSSNGIVDGMDGMGCEDIICKRLDEFNESFLFLELSKSLNLGQRYDYGKQFFFSLDVRFDLPIDVCLFLLFSHNGN